MVPNLGSQFLVTFRWRMRRSLDAPSDAAAKGLERSSQGQKFAASLGDGYLGASLVGR